MSLVNTSTPTDGINELIDPLIVGLPVMNQPPRHTTHSKFVPVPPESNHDISARVTVEFAKALGRLTGKPARVLDVEPLEGLDARIEHDGLVAFIELTSYRQRDERHEVERDDSIAKATVSEALADARLTNVTVSLKWRAVDRRNRKKGQSRKRMTVPKGDQLVALAGDVVKLVASCRNTSPNLSIFFLDNPQVDDLESVSGYWVASPLDYRTLSDFCDTIHVRHHECEALRTARSNLDTRFVDVDRDQLADVIRKKNEKLAGYRMRVKEAEIWLVIHADGSPPSTRLPSDLRGKAVAIICKELANYDRRFDRVWWAENTAFLDATELVEIVRP